MRRLQFAVLAPDCVQEDLLALLEALGEGRYFSIWRMWLRRLRIGEEGGGLVIPARRRRWHLWQQAEFAWALARTVIGRNGSSPGPRYREAAPEPAAGTISTAPPPAVDDTAAPDKDGLAAPEPQPMTQQAEELTPLAAGGWDDLKAEEALESRSLDKVPAWERGPGQTGSDPGGMPGDKRNSSGPSLDDDDVPIVRGSTGRLKLPSLRRWVTNVDSPTKLS